METDIAQIFKAEGLTIRSFWGHAEGEEVQSNVIDEAIDVPDVEEEYQPELKDNRRPAWMPLDLIVPNPDQPRKLFKKKEMEELTKTIKAGGVIEPILVAPYDRRFMLISGERRWRAAKAAGLERVLVIIEQGLSKMEIFKKAVIANLHQEQMHILELANALRKIQLEEGWSVAQLASFTGKSEGTIRNVFKVFGLHSSIQAGLLREEIPPGNALHFATYPIERQPELKARYQRYILKELHGINPVPQQTARILRKLAEELGINPIKPKKGRKILTHAEMAIRSMRKIVEKITKELELFDELDILSLRSARAQNPLQAITDLEQLADLIEDVCERTKKKLGHTSKVIPIRKS